MRYWWKHRWSVKLFLKIALTLTVYVRMPWRVRSRRWTAAAWRPLASAFSPRPVSCAPLFPLEFQPQICCPEKEPASGKTQNYSVASNQCISSLNPNKKLLCGNELQKLLKENTAILQIFITYPLNHKCTLAELLFCYHWSLHPMTETRVFN